MQRASGDEIVTDIRGTGPDRSAGDPEPATQQRASGNENILSDRYVLERRIGEGGMGAVFQARDLSLERAKDRRPFVALKVLRGNLLEQRPDAYIALQREAVRTRTLGHHNIVRVYDFGIDGDTYYITMELLEGQSLLAKLKTRPRGLTQRHALFYLEQICAGLAYAHSQRIVHSDLKPGNIFITQDDVVKILDFGIASPLRSIEKADEDTAFDARKFGALSPTYASPQQFERMEADPRDDIYSLACVAYQMLSGQLPFGEHMSPMASHLNLPVPPIAALNQRQNRALANALHFDRARRTSTVEQFFEELNGGRVSSASSWRWVGIGVAAAAILGVAGIAWYRQSMPEVGPSVGSHTPTSDASPVTSDSRSAAAAAGDNAVQPSVGASVPMVECNIDGTDARFESLLQRGLDAQIQYGLASDDPVRESKLEEIRAVAGCLQSLSERRIDTAQSRAWLKDVASITSPGSPDP